MNIAIPGSYHLGSNSGWASSVPAWKLLPSRNDFVGTKATQTQLQALQDARDRVMAAFHREEHPFHKAALWERYKGLCSIGCPIYQLGRRDPIFPY